MHFRYDPVKDQLFCLSIPHLSNVKTICSQTLHSCFSDFVDLFKIRLIKLGFPFKKTKMPVFELTTYRFSVKSHNHHIKEPTVRGRP